MSAALPDVLSLAPPSGSVRARVRPPGSKSLTNRAAIVAALAEGTSTLSGVLDSDDTQVMRRALTTLGLSVTHDAAERTLRIVGLGGEFPAAYGTETDLDLNNSGTSIRFLTAAIAAGRGRGTVSLDGNARMRQRPIADLLDALRQLGVEAFELEQTGCPPVQVQLGMLAGGEVAMRGDVSSQFLSAVLMAAPLAQQSVTVRIDGELVSRPYVDMTIAVMQAFGGEVTEPEPNVFVVEAKPYRATDYAIEPDASAASYWLAAGALAGEVTVEGLSRESLQGDVGFADVLGQMGADVVWNANGVTVRSTGSLVGVDLDMGPISDTAQTAAVVAMFADGPTRISGVEHMRHKETDRVAALVAEIRRLGLAAEEFADGLTIHPGVPSCREPVATYDDHRMAMSFALASLHVPITIAEPECVGKTYPEFWTDWRRHVLGEQPPRLTT